MSTGIAGRSHSLVALAPSLAVDAPSSATALAHWRLFTETGLSLLLLAVLLTLVNCVKPLHVDDAAYVLHASHIAQHPATPYDSIIYWDYQFHQGNHVLAPPVFLYWLAASESLFGDEPFLWKLTLLPWHLLLVSALFVLFRRWATPLELPLTWMTVLSPALLPSTNLMLDVPALTLSLASLALFVWACDRGWWTASFCAGLLAGLAMQTKYSAFVAPAVLLAYAWAQRRLAFGLVAAGAAVVLFAGWEFFVIMQHRESHFLAAAGQRDGSFFSRVSHLIMPTAVMSAALSPGLFFLGTFGWIRSGRWLAGIIAVVAAGFLLLGASPAWFDALARNLATSHATVPLDALLYGALTILWWSLIAANVVGHAQKRKMEGVQQAVTSRWFWFLLVWLLLEIGGAVVLSPFPAARRVLGVVVASTMLMGHVVSKQPQGRRLVWTCAGAGMVLGALVALIDLHEALATEQLVEAAGKIAQHESSGGRSWFSGIWAFQFHAMRHGMEPLAPNGSELHAGDLLVLAEQQANRIDFHPGTAPLELVQVVTLEDNVPWQTLICYYAGRTPVQHHVGPRLRVFIYRALRDFVPDANGVLPPISATKGQP
jgi:hypothetical protein